jgi:aquaporin Z
MTQGQRLGAEALGTFWLVLGGCGSAVFAAQFTGGLGIGFLGVALAFGLTVLTGAYALGHISGGHFNPAVTIGLTAARRFDPKEVVGYVIAQLVGAIVASGLIWVILEGRPGFESSGNFLAANGFGKGGAADGFGSPGGYNLLACLVTEVVFTFIFLMVILGITDRRAPAGFAPLGIGLCLTLIHLVTIPITNTSVNPARSIGPALFTGGEALKQVWLFIVAPIAGAVLAAFAHRFIAGSVEPEPPAEIS